MNRARKKFIIYAVSAIFVMLTVLLSVINIINFTMVASDADRVTLMIASDKGALVPDGRQVAPRGGDFERMGPGSPELAYTARYYTVRFDKDGTPQTVAFKISALSENEAVEKARKLAVENVGWTDTVYRYRVYTEGDYTYVTVADFGRELLPSYRILFISIIGEIVGLLICIVFLVLVSERLFSPLEKAERKQKAFIANAENEFKIPLTVINTNLELIERENGRSEYTAAINRQVKKMTALNRRIAALALFEEENKTACDLSEIAKRACENYLPRFREKGAEFTFNIGENLTLSADGARIEKAFDEILKNALLFSQKRASIEVLGEAERITVTAANDTTLAEGYKEQAFDRFVKLENADDTAGDGLGLSYVKDVVTDIGGRLWARVKDGEFILKIAI